MLAAFPDAYLEDPHFLPGIAERLGGHLDRVSYDAPIREPEDIGATPLDGRVVNVRPSRIGGLRGRPVRAPARQPARAAAGGDRLPLGGVGPRSAAALPAARQPPM
ncbi:MAG: hypothetical protein HZB46_07665 [Solirubrobacterales bacterium]|nr:hypothetical protein [Solirubrobacterales bacterium]